MSSPVTMRKRRLVLHLAHELIVDGVRARENFLLSHAQHVVVKGCAVHDVAWLPVGMIGGVVHDDGGIAGACGDDTSCRSSSPPPTTASPPVTLSSVMSLMVHDDVAAGLQRRLFHRGACSVSRSRPRDTIASIIRRIASCEARFAAGWGLKTTALPAGNHADGVVDDGSMWGWWRG